ncbi:unnamed protein product, partial [Staurois parvus]
AKEVQNGLEGCIQGLRLGETSSGITLPKPSNIVNVKTGCSVQSACDPNPCLGNSSCVDTWLGHTCVCNPGYFGENCVDICQLNPCENKGLCRHQPNSPLGYTCECTGHHYGRYCEHRMDHQCPKGWWGNRTCGP